MQFQEIKIGLLMRDRIMANSINFEVLKDTISNFSSFASCITLRVMHLNYANFVFLICAVISEYSRTYSLNNIPLV